MAMKTNTIATYTKNVAKSIGYSVIDEIKNSNPAIKAFGENNADVMKSTYHAITHMKQTVSSLSQSILDSKAGALGKQAVSNIKEDLKTGKFYNMERKQKSESAVASSWMSVDGDEDDFDFEGLADGNFDAGGGEDENDISLEDMMDLVGKKSSEAVSDVIVKTAEYSAEVQTDLARASAEQAQSIYANLHAGMGTINENISKMIEIANGPLTDHMQNSQKYYESESALSQERNDLLKQILEIQKGMYSKKGQDYSKDRITMSQIMDEGMPDLETYFKAIKKNMDNASGGMFDMFKEYLENGMLETMIASPLEGLTSVVAKTIIPKTLTEAMKTFNKSLSGAFSSIMSQMMNSDSDNSVFNFIKNLFGIDDYTKTSISTGRYEKGAVPFDGIVRKSIVEVIPTYLSRIESALTHNTERRYDYETGKFVGIDKIKKGFKELEDQASRRAGYDVTNYLDRYVKAIDFGDNEKRKKSLQKNIERLMKTSFKRGVIFNPKDFDSMASDMGLKGKYADDDFEIIRRMFETIPKDVLMGYAKEMYAAKDSMSRTIQMKEESGHDISNALFNNSLDKSTVSGGKKNKKGKKNNTNSSSLQETVEGGGTNKEKKDKKKKKKDKNNDDDDSSPDNEEEKRIKEDKNKKKKVKYDPDDLEGMLESATDIFREENVLKTDKDKKTLLQRLKASEKLSDGMKKFIDRTDTLLHKPTEFLAGFIKKADTALYKMIFGVDYDEDGERKSVAKAIFDGLKDNFNHFKDWMDKKILDPIKTYFDKEGTLGNRVKTWFKGRTDQFKQSSFGSRFFKTTSGAADYVKSTVSDAVKAAGKAAEEGLGVKGTKESSTADDLRDAIKDQAADGIKKIRKTGVMAVSEGEMVIPPDMNPFNIDKRIKKENAAKKKFADAFIKNIPNFGGGTVNVEGSEIDVDNANKAIAENWKNRLETEPEVAKEEFAKLPKELQKRILSALDKRHSSIIADKIHEKVSSITSLFGGAIKRGRKGDNENSIESEQKSLAAVTVKEVKKFAPEVAAGSLIGTGIIGLIGGPLIGAALGGAMALSKNSEAFNEKLFGEIAQSGDEKGKRQGGLFSKELSQAIQKYGPSMLKGGTIGAITSLLPFVPGGPLVGILAGSAIGFASQNDDIRERLFGEEGLLGKNFDTKFKKALPALGAGAAIGYLTGPFGTVTNILLGSALGWASTTDTVKNYIFGEPDDNGKRHGGLIENVVKDIFSPFAEFTKNTMVDLIEWSKENIKRPLADAVDPLKKQFSLMGKGIMDGINKLFEEKLGATLDKLIKERIINPVSGFLKKALGLAMFPIKAIVKAPFSLIGAVGDSLRNRQINRGNADYMSADQRIAFRNQGGLLRKLHLSERSRKWDKYDEAFSNMSGKEAGDLASKLSFALDQESALEKSNNAAHEEFTRKVRSNRKLSATNVDKIAKAIKDYVNKDKDLDKAKEKAHIYIASIKGLTDRERREISEAVDEYLASIASHRETSKEFGNNKQQLIKALQESNTFKEAGIKDISEEDLPKLLKYLEAESKFKTVTADGEAIHADKLAGDLPSFNEEEEKRHKETMDILEDINVNLAALTKPSNSETERIYGELRSSWDSDRARGERIRNIRDSVNGAAHAAREGVRGAGEYVYDKGVWVKRSLVGKRGDDWRRPGDIPSYASGIQIVPETGIAAISKGELIIPPDLNPFNINKRKKDEEKAKKNFMDSIPGFAEGGQLDDDETVDPTKKNSIFDSFINKAKRRVKIVFDQAGRQYKYREDDNGELVMDTSDPETVNSMNEARQEKEEKKTLLNTITGFPHAIAEKFGRIFNGDEEDKKNKKGILGKLFSMFGGGKDGSKGLIGKGIAAVIGIPLLTGMFKKFFGETELGQSIGNKVQSIMDGLNLTDKFNSISHGIVNWLAGGPDAIGGGLPGLLVAAASHWATGFEFIATKIAPKAIEILVKALPSMLLGVVKGIGAIITENFHNAIHGGSGSNGLAQADKDLGNQYSGDINVDQILSSSDGNASLVFNGRTYTPPKTFAQIAGSNNGGIVVPNIASGIVNAVTSGMKVLDNSNQTSNTNIVEANKLYDAGIKNGSIADYKNTDSYKSLSEGMQNKLDEQLLSLEKDGKNVVQINTGTAENPNYEYKTLQEILASDMSVYTYVDENGQTHNLTGMDILNNPTIGKQFGLDWQLSDEERQQIKEDKGWAKDSSIKSTVMRLGTKKLLTADSGKTGLRTMGKVAGHVPVIGKPLKAALYGADYTAQAAGKIGSKLGTENLGNKSVSALGKVGNALKGGGDLVRTTESATGTLMTRSEALAKGLTEEMGDFTVEKSSKVGKLGEKLGMKKVGQETMEQTAKKAAEGESKDLVNKIVKWVTSHLNDIVGNSKIFEFVTKALKKAGKNCSKEGVEKALKSIMKVIEKQAVPAFIKKIETAGAKVIAKFASKIFSGGIVGLLFSGAAFMNAYDNSKSVLGIVDDESIDYDPSFVTRLMCGIAGFINETFFNSLVGLDTIFNILYPIAKEIFGLNTEEIDKARELSQEFLKNVNMAEDTNMTVQEYNDKDKLSTKIKNGAKNVGKKLADFFVGAEKNGKNTTKAQDAGKSSKKETPKTGKTLAKSGKGLAGSIANIGASLGVAPVQPNNSDNSSDNSAHTLYETSSNNKQGSNVSNETISYSSDTSAHTLYDDAATVTNSNGEYYEDSSYYAEDAYSSAEKPVTELLKDGKSMSLLIKTHLTKSFTQAKSGKNGDYFKTPKSDSKNPYSWIEVTIAGANKFMMSPVLFTTVATKSLSSKVKSLLSGGTSIISNVKSDLNSLSKFSKKNMNNYWSVKTSSNGIFSPIETIMKSITRTLYFPFILMKEINKDAEDSFKKLQKQSKASETASSIANIGSNIANELKNKSNNNDDTAGSGSRLKGFNGRGSNPKSDSKYADDPTFVSQIDKRYAGESFNVSGDSGKQTIADTGCGPAAAAMVVNNAYQQDALSMKDAAKNALRYKVKDGGVNAAYFENEFSRHGLATEYIMDDNQKLKNQSIIDNLKYGNRTVLMGQDTSNDSKVNSPYGPNDHYIVATRISPDNKYIWVNDPESNTPEVKYPASTILNNTRLGIAGKAASGSRLLNKIHAGGSLTQRLRKLHGRGKYGPDTIQYKVWSGLKGAGYNDIASAAAMGNIQHESAFNPSTIEKGSGAGFGLIQWTGPRRVAYENFARSQGKSPSDLGCQIKYMLQELQEGSGQWTKADPAYGLGSLTRNDWANGSNIDTATKAFMCCFERPDYSPSVNHIDRRLASAKEYLQEFAGITGDASAIGSDGENGSSSSGGSILDDILGVFDDLAVGYGLKKKSTSSSDGSSGGVSGGSDKQRALVDKMKSVQGKLKYSQVNRNPDTGSGDCSSTVQWAYKNVLGVDPGSWTGAQETNSDLYTVADNANDLSKLQPGDLLLYRKGGVSTHVEMYAGDGQMIGHGGGMGPKLRPVQQTLGSQSVVMARRWTGFKDGGGASGSGLLGTLHARATGLDPNKEIKISDTTKDPIMEHTDKRGFLKKSRYKNDMKKNIEIKADMFAAGAELDSDEKSNNYKVPGMSNTNVTIKPVKDTTTESSRSNNKLMAYLEMIKKLLTKEVQNTSMLSTIVTILTELVKTYEEERAIDKSSSNAEQQKSMLESKRMAMMNILKSTGIQSGGNNELSKLMADAERLARI